MPSKDRITYGSKVKKRAKRLLKAILDYVDCELEDVEGIELKYRWQDETTTEPKLTIKTTLNLLNSLTAKDKEEGELSTEEIRRVLKDHFAEFLKIFEDHRVQKKGSDGWHFTLTLWSRDQQKNLQEFETLWDKKRPPKSEEASHRDSASSSKKTDGKIPSNLRESTIPKFVGREEALTTLHQHLQEGEGVTISTVKGMGGVGKTELAKQYAKKYKDEYPGGIAWFEVRDRNFASEILSFAQVYLNFNPAEDLPLERRIEACWINWQPQKGNILVVLDDVPDDQAIPPNWLPQNDRFKIVVTTRQQNLLQRFKRLNLKVLSKVAALELLRTLVGKERINQEIETAKTLCERLEFLPLGLELVGMYLQRRESVSLEKMLQRLEKKGLNQKALQEATPEMTAKLGVKAAFELSWQELTLEAQHLACFFSLFAMKAVPWELMEKAWSEVDEEDLEDWREELVGLSLLEDNRDGTYQFHQLIREFCQGNLERLNFSFTRGDGNNFTLADKWKRAYCQTMVAEAKKIPQTPTLEIIRTVEPTIPHIQEVANQLTDWLSNEDEELLTIFSRLACFNQGQGLYELALPWLKKCLDITKQQLGEKHPDVATSLNNLASLYSSQGRYEEAEPLYTDALSLRRELLGEKHPDVATSLNNLAGLYESQGRYEEAEPLYTDALSLRRELLGEKHPDVAISLNNLAALYNSLGRYEDAEPLHEKALSLTRELLGEKHPHVAQSLNNLAALYNSLGRYEEAEPLCVDALSLGRELLGEKHPHVAISLNNLAGVYSAQGRYEEAELLYKKALVLGRELLGEKHPRVASALHNLACVYKSQGQYEEADPLLKEALSLRRELLGEKHPDVASSLNNLAFVYGAQGLYEEAEPLYLGALEIRMQRLGENHPHTQLVQENFRLFLETVLETGREKELSDHPITQGILTQIQQP